MGRAEWAGGPRTERGHLVGEVMGGSSYDLVMTTAPDR